LIDKVRTYIDAGLSPLTQCYNRRNILAGAVLGRKQEVVKLILSKTYLDKIGAQKDLSVKLLTDTDNHGSTPLHYAYAKHQSGIRKLLRLYAKEKHYKGRKLIDYMET
jgi:hypothetical protein